MHSEYESVYSLFLVIYLSETYKLEQKLIKLNLLSYYNLTRVQTVNNTFCKRELAGNITIL